MEPYLDLVEDILENGNESDDRTGTGTRSLFGKQMEFDIDYDAFPVVTTRKIYWEKVLDELFWFLSGSTNVNDLPERTQSWWEPWADDDGELGPIYGKQLRDYEYPVGTGAVAGHKDQVREVINSIQEKPESRRHIMTTWNPGDVNQMQLPPCHGLVIQFYVNDGRLSSMMVQRSADICVGVPNNITSYCFLTAMVAEVCDYDTGTFTHMIGDAHIYQNHIEKAKEQVKRESKELPKLSIKSKDKIDEYSHDDINLRNYTHHDPINYEVAV